MNILLTGSTQIASMLACQLSQEGHNVTVMDEHLQGLNAIKDKADVAIIHARPTYPQSFKMANATNKDLLIAVHEMDEINMLSCQMAHSLFKIPKKIAKISSPHYLVRHELFGDSDLPIDIFINSDGLVIEYIEQHLHYESNVSIVPFAFNDLNIIDITLDEHQANLHATTHDILKFLPGDITQIMAIERAGVLQSITPELALMKQDRVVIISEKTHLKTILKLFDIKKKSHPNIMIAGGGNIGSNLGKKLSTQYNVKLIENDEQRCYELAKEAPYLTVLHADATDKQILIDENIENIDCFCATTGDDEDNLISAIQANHLGAKQTLCLINRENYLDIFNNNTPNRLILPHRLISQHIFQHIHPGRFIENKPLIHNGLRLILAEVCSHSESIEKALPKHTNALAVKRNGHWQPYDSLQPKDHVLLLSQHEEDISTLDHLFQ